MAKIKFGGVRVDGEHNDTVHVILADTVEEEGEKVERTLGEAFVSIPAGMTNPKIKKAIIDAAQQIMDRHKEALAKRAKLDQVEFPDIT